MLSFLKLPQNLFWFLGSVIIAYRTPTGNSQVSLGIYILLSRIEVIIEEIDVQKIKMRDA